MFKRTLSVLLSLSIMLTGFAPVVFADTTDLQLNNSEISTEEQYIQTETVSEADENIDKDEAQKTPVSDEIDVVLIGDKTETVTENVVKPDEEFLPENDELFAGFVEQQFYENSVAVFGISAREQLNSVEQKIYDVLKSEITKVAKNGGVAQFVIEDPSTVGLKKTWTREELGVTSIDEPTTAEEVFTAQYDTAKIMDALLHDCPYELYWFDKTSGMTSGYSYSRSYYSTAPNEYISINFSYLTFVFAVSQNYQSASNTAAVTTNVSKVDTAVVNAAAIAQKYDSYSDYDKLTAFKGEICELTSYNSNAALVGSFKADNDPWQLVYVFDDDTSTNVVCEGYSKAFQYLCDISEFDNTECYTVSGTMAGGTGAGGHMWNIVTMDDGKNYLVDVTNSDDGSVGQNGGLFIAGTSGSMESGYIFYVGNQNITYTYYDDTIALFGSEVLELATEDYIYDKLDEDPNIQYGTIIDGGNCGNDAEWHLYDSDADNICDILVISGTGEMYNYNSYNNKSPWYTYKDNVKSVVIENGITTIGKDTFCVFNSLEDVIISESVISIGESAFAGCKLLKNIKIPKNVEIINYGAFKECSALEIVDIGDRLTTIGDFAFYYCEALKSVKMPESVISIQKYAFNSTALEIVTIPENLTTVGEKAFGGCHLKYILYTGTEQQWDNLLNNNPDGYLKTNKVFFNTCKGDHNYIDASCISPQYCTICNAITQTELGHDIDYVSNGDGTETGYCSRCNEYFTRKEIIAEGNCAGNTAWYLWDSDSDTIGDTLVITGEGEMDSYYWDKSPWDSYKTDIDTVIIENGITSIGSGSFKKFNYLDNVTIPESVTRIGSYAFDGCISLKNIDIPEQVTTIGDYAFYNCSSLESIELPKGIVNLYRNVLCGCSSLKTVEIPYGVTSIGGWAFGNCTNLESVYIPETVKTISFYAFGYCESLKEIKIPDGVEIIDNSTFYYCKSLESVSLPQNLTQIYSSAFERCINLQNIEIPQSVTNISEYAFSCCNELKNVTLPKSITAINAGVFNNCKNLVSINIPEGVTIIDEDAFSDCLKMKTVHIPESIVNINESAFENCNELEYVFYGGTEKRWKSIYICEGNDNLLNATILPRIALEGIYVENFTIEIGKPSNLPLIKKIPENATDEYSIEWSIDGINVAELIDTDEGQKILAKSYGSAVITATDSISGKSDTAVVTTKLPATEQLRAKVYLAGDSQNGLKFSETARIEISSETAGIIPNDKFNFTSDAKVTVDENGVVTSVYAGEKPDKAVITAALKTETKSVKVEIPLIVALTGISLKDVKAELGKTSKLPTVTKVPATAGEDIVVEWSVLEGSEDIIELITDEKNETVIKPKKIGTAILTATDKNNGFTANSIVKVTLPTKVNIKLSTDTAVESLGLQTGENKTLVVRYVMDGVEYTIPNSELTFKATEDKKTSKNVIIDEAGVLTSVYTGSGSKTVTVTATLKNDSSKKATLKVKVIAKQATAVPVTVGEIEDIHSSGYTASVVPTEYGYTVIVPKQMVAEGNITFDLSGILDEAAFEAAGAKVPEVSWATSNKNIAAVTAVKAADLGEGEGYKAVVTVKKNANGIATVTATANDISKVQTAIDIDVRDYTPRLESNTVTLNTYKKEGVSVKLYTAYNTLLKDYDEAMVMLMSEDEDEEISVQLEGNENFVAEYDKANSRVVINAVDILSNTKKGKEHKLTLVINTSMGVTRQTVKVAVANSLPKVTVKQIDTFNSFYKDSEVFTEVTAKGAVITGINLIDTPTFAAEFVPYAEATDDTAAQQSGITVSWADKENPATGYVKNSKKQMVADTSAKVEVTLEGYRKAATASYTVKIKETAPKLVQSRSSNKYTYLNRENEAITVTNSTAGEAVQFTDNWKVTSSSDNYVTVTASETGDKLNITVNETNKFTSKKPDHTVKIAIREANWIKPVTVSHKVTVKLSKPKASTKNTSVTLRPWYEDSAEIVFTLSESNCPVPVFSFESTSSKEAVKAEAAKINFVADETDGRNIRAVIADATIADGTYSYKVTPIIRLSETEIVALSAVTVKVTVGTAVPSISLSAKTVTLNGAGTDTAQITVKASDTECPVPAEYVITADTKDKKVKAEAEKIDFVTDGWNITARFKDLNNLPNNGSYKFKVKAYVTKADGSKSELKSATVTVKVATTSPKVTLSKTSVTLNQKVAEGYTIETGVNSGYKVLDMTAATSNSTARNKLSVVCEDGVIRAKVTDSTIKNGTYSYTVTTTVQIDKEDVTKTSTVKNTLKITVKSGTPTLKTSASGSIDLAVREKGITYTITGGNYFNYSKEAINTESFVLSGTYKDGLETKPITDLFEISDLEEDSKGRMRVLVKAKDEAAIKNGTTYKYKIGVNVAEIGTVYSSTFSVKTKQAALKFKVSGDTTVYHKHESGSIMVDVTSPAGAAIADEAFLILDTKATTVPKGAISYEIERVDGDSYVIHYDITRASKLVVGKSYKLTIAVTPKGNASNKSAQTLTVTIKVKR